MSLNVAVLTIQSLFLRLIRKTVVRFELRLIKSAASGELVLLVQYLFDARRHKLRIIMK